MNKQWFIPVIFSLGNEQIFTSEQNNSRALGKLTDKASTFQWPCTADYGG